MITLIIKCIIDKKQGNINQKMYQDNPDHNSKAKTTPKSYTTKKVNQSEKSSNVKFTCVSEIGSDKKEEKVSSKFVNKTTKTTCGYNSRLSVISLLKCLLLFSTLQGTDTAEQQCNMISTTNGKISYCDADNCIDKYVTMSNMKPYETLCLANNTNQVSHSIRVLSKGWKCEETSLYHTSDFQVGTEEMTYCPSPTGICNSQFKCEQFNSSYCDGFKDCSTPGFTQCMVYAENYQCLQNIGVCGFIRWSVLEESLKLKELVKCEVWNPYTVLEILIGDKKTISTIPSGVTTSIDNIDINVNVPGSAILNFGPFFL